VNGGFTNVKSPTSEQAACYFGHSREASLVEGDHVLADKLNRARLIGK
jgi:hypothetical protein